MGKDGAGEGELQDEVPVPSTWPPVTPPATFPGDAAHMGFDLCCCADMRGSGVFHYTKHEPCVIVLLLGVSVCLRTCAMTWGQAL